MCGRQKYRFGRELWSSGYGRRLMFQRLWVRIPAMYTGCTFLTFICCKNCHDVCLKRQKINDKRGRGWPVFKISIFIRQLSFRENEILTIRIFIINRLLILIISFEIKCLKYDTLFRRIYVFACAAIKAWSDNLALGSTWAATSESRRPGTNIAKLFLL